MCSNNKEKLAESISNSQKNNNSDELFHSAHYDDYRKITPKELRANTGTINAIKSIVSKEKEKNR